MKFYRFVFIILPALILTACVSVADATHESSVQTDRATKSEAYVSDFPVVSLNQIAQDVTKDVFKSGDIADVRVYNVEELTQTYVVDRSGKISFPLIGSLKVAGLSTTQLQEILIERYGADFLHTPSINVKLEPQDLGRVVVDGAVNKPGVFDVNDIITLSEAIALAQGLNGENTNGSSVFIIRTINGERKIKEVDLRQIRKLRVSNTQIIPGDIVFVEDSVGRVLFKEFLRTVPLLNSAAIIATR